MKKGDRVIVNGEYDGLGFKNCKGVIVNVGNGYYTVEFEEYINGRTWSKDKPGHCWIVSDDMLKHYDIEDEIEELESRISTLKEQLNKKYEPMKGNYFVRGDTTIVYKDHVLDDYLKAGRVFDTQGKALKAIDIMVKHDIILKYVIDHAPEYEFDKENLYNNYCVVYFNGKWVMGTTVEFYHFGTIYMPKWVAEHLVDDLNNNRIEGV